MDIVRQLRFTHGHTLIDSPIEQLVGRDDDYYMHGWTTFIGRGGSLSRPLLACSSQNFYRLTLSANLFL